MKACYRLVSVVVVVSLMVSQAWAGGLWIYELGNPGTGLAAAGWAAAAQDASTAFTNPAGMTRLSQSQLLVGLQPMFAKVKFDAAPGTTTPGGDGGNAGLFAPGLTAFYVHKVSSKLSLGVSSISYIGAGVKYLDGWSGRYYLQETHLITLSLIPAVAYQINDWLSVGGGVGLVYGKLRQRAAINNALDGSGYPDGTLRLNSSAFSLQGIAGILVTPRQGTRFGVSYVSPVSLDFRDVVRLDGLGPTLWDDLQSSGLAGSKVDLTYTLPQQVMISCYQQVTDKLALLANVGWQNWSAFGNVGVSVSGSTSRSFTADAKFRDTWHVALGAQYRIQKNVLLSAGFAFDSSPVSDVDRKIALALDRQFRYSGGVQFDLRPDLTLGFAYTFWDLGPAPVDEFRGSLAGRLVGDFKANHVHIANVNLIWRRY